MLAEHFAQKIKIAHRKCLRKTSKNTRNACGKVRPEEKDSTRLQEPSLVKNTYFGAIH